MPRRVARTRAHMLRWWGKREMVVVDRTLGSTAESRGHRELTCRSAAWGQGARRSSDTVVGDLWSGLDEGPYLWIRGSQ